ncbi:hypothetical protein L7F22_011028 [Adiantum nelumboides]|nr:hypothetical protein [Adiantum nelumboides]
MGMGESSGKGNWETGNAEAGSWELTEWGRAAGKRFRSRGKLRGAAGEDWARADGNGEGQGIREAGIAEEGSEGVGMEDGKARELGWMTGKLERAAGNLRKDSGMAEGSGLGKQQLRHQFCNANY